MLGTNNFIKSTIMFLFTVFLIANILYAFNINVQIGGVNVGPQAYNGDLSHSYFGFSTFISSWEEVFQNDSFLNDINRFLKILTQMMDVVSFTNFLESVNAGSNAGSDIIVVLGTILDTVFNIFYIGLNIGYVFGTIFYVISVVFVFIAFVTKMVSGMYYTPLPNTQFPEIVPTMRLVLSYFNEII